MFRRCAIRELNEELRMGIGEDALPSLPKAIVWDNSQAKSVQHLGLFFELYTSRSIPGEAFHDKTFYEAAEKSLKTEFVPLDYEWNRIENLETWSKAYLRQVYGIDFPDWAWQTRMF